MTKTLNPIETTKTAIDYDSIIEAAADTGEFNISDIDEVLDWHSAAASGPIVSIRGWKRGHFRVEFSNGDFAYFFTSSVATMSNADVAEAMEAAAAPADWHKGEFIVPIVSSPTRSAVKETAAPSAIHCGLHQALDAECVFCGETVA